MKNELLFDAWTALTFKRQFGPRRVAGTGYVAPGWVGENNQRRLLAYKILQAFLDNAAREFLATTDNEKKNEHREYGDAQGLRNAALSALLGDDQTIVVDGAAEQEEAEGDDEETAAADALGLQEWFEEWADDERMRVKVQECERNAVGLGDGVYTLGWSGKKNRPRLRVYDPGFYFPVLDDGNEDEFPTKVHIAWEYDGDEPGDVFVRRLTWEMVPLEAETRLPYTSDPVDSTCLFTDAVWKLGPDVRTVDDLSPSAAMYQLNEDGEEVNRLDLGIDFLPVIHISNTVALSDHFGQSVITHVAQILDDIANADSDLSAASATTGTPPIAMSGVSTDRGSLTYKPGMVFRLGEGGRMDVLDTSKSLDALLQYVDSLLERLSVNGRVPAALLGRVKPSEVPSGVALALSFGPLTALVREMRLARAEKYQLLFKFVHRLALVGGVDGVPVEHPTTDYVFGSYLPNDNAAAVQLVTRLLDAKAISLEQAVMLLRASGITDREQDQEITAIQARDFEGANRLFDATGSLELVFEYLGLPQPTITLPAPPGGGTAGPPSPPPPPPDEDEVPGAVETPPVPVPSTGT